MKHPRITPLPERERAWLRSYDPSAYPPTAVTVDLVVLTIRDDTLQALLVRRGSPPYEGYWALPGGFVLPEESLDAAAARELREETDITETELYHEQLKTYGDPARDPRMRVVSVAYLAFAPVATDPRGGSDASDARFWPVGRVGRKSTTGPLAYDHHTILDEGVERARAKLEYTTLATRFCPAPFTLAELRRVYEIVWGVDLDPANFRRKILSCEGAVEPLAQRRSSGPGRPAELYRPGGASLLSTPFAERR